MDSEIPQYRTIEIVKTIDLGSGIPPSEQPQQIHYLSPKAALFRRVNRLLAGDFAYDHFSSLLLYLREHAGKTSYLREFGDFLAHPERDRGPLTEKAREFLQLCIDQLDKHGTIDREVAEPKLNELVVRLEVLYFELRETMLKMGLLDSERDADLVRIYDALMIFTLANLHGARVDCFVLSVQAIDGIVGVYGSCEFESNRGKFQFGIPLFRSTLNAHEWLPKNGGWALPLGYSPAPSLYVL